MCDLLKGRDSRRVFQSMEAGGSWTGRKATAIDQMVLFDPIDVKLEKIPYIFKYH